MLRWTSVSRVGSLKTWGRTWTLLPQLTSIPADCKRPMLVATHVWLPRADKLPKRLRQRAPAPCYFGRVVWSCNHATS